MELLEASPQRDGLRRAHLPVNLDAYVDGGPDGLSHRSDSIDGLGGPFGIRPPQPELGGEGAESHRGEAGLDDRRCIRGKLLSGVSDHVHVAPDPVAGLAAHEIVDRHVEALPLDVPQRDVDGRQRSVYHGAHEVGVAVQELIMVLDLRRVFAQQVRLARLYHRLGGPLPSVDPTFADPDGAVLAVDLDDEPTLPQVGLDLLDFRGFHTLSVREIGVCPCRLRRGPVGFIYGASSFAAYKVRFYELIGYRASRRGPRVWRKCTGSPLAGQASQREMERDTHHARWQGVGQAEASRRAMLSRLQGQPSLEHITTRGLRKSCCIAIYP